jgi:hypothetical protein
MARFLRSSLVLSLGLGAAVFNAGCDDKPAAQSSPQPAAAAEALPAGLIVTQAPAGAKGVAEVRQSAAEGEEVVLHGRIAGSESPFTEGRAQFQLIDSKIKNCKEMEGDSCPTPWDMCCEDKKTIVDNSVTVQVVGSEGRPLKAELKGVSGLKPLSEVAVKGKVHKSADGKVVTVDATEMYVTPG